MDLESAIKHAEEVMVENMEKTKGRNASDPIAINCFECAEEYRQLAEWLKDYKWLLEQEPYKDIATFKEDVLDAISRIGLSKRDTKEVQAVAECLRAVEALSPVMPLSKGNERNIAPAIVEDKTERYKDCFQPKNNEKPCSSQQEHVEEDAKAFREVATAFQLGLSFGFIDGLNANKTQESEDKE